VERQHVVRHQRIQRISGSLYHVLRIVLEDQFPAGHDYALHRLDGS